MPDSKIVYLSYDITWEPIEDPVENPLTEAEKDLLIELYYKSLEGDHSALQPLLELKSKYPDMPRIDNYLLAYYVKSEQQDKADQLVQETYKKFPDYLFAKIAYGNWCLQKNDIAGFEQVFEGKYDLKLLYPDRDVFHISEFLPFQQIICFYKAKLGDWRHIEKVIKYRTYALDSGKII